MDEKDKDNHDEPCRSSRLTKPRRSPRINKASWINDDLNDLKFMTYDDDRVYENEGKIEIVPITSSDSLNETNINNTLEHSIKSNKKVCFKSPSHASKKIKALATMVLGTMVSSFNIVIDNYTVNPIGITNEIPDPIHYTHVLETKLGIIDELGKYKDPSNCPLLTHANLTMKKDLQFIDIINDEEDEDTSFVPSTILDHRIMKNHAVRSTSLKTKIVRGLLILRL